MPDGDPHIIEAPRRPLLSSARTWKQALHTAAGVLWPWRIRAPVILGIVLALWYFGTPYFLGPQVTVDTVVQADFVQSVVASGNVAAPNRINIGAQITGVVANVPVAEGQVVKAADPLIILDDREAQAAVVQAQGVVAEATARMRQLRELTVPAAMEALKQANATLVDAQSAYDQAAKLNSTGFATKVTLQDAVKILDIARAQLHSAQLTVFTNQPGGSDQVMAQTQLNQANASLAAAQSRLSYTIIKAPRAGTLISRNVELGDTVQPPTVLMTLSPAGDTELVVQIDEKNLGLIAIGQTALVSADAYPKVNFPADVDYINPGINLQTASVEVKLKVVTPPLYLTQDMTVSVDIEVARHPGVLIISAASVRGLSGGKPWVLKVAAGRATRQPVTLGLVSSGKAEIASGLVVGDQIVPATSAVVDGGALRAQPAAAAKP